MARFDDSSPIYRQIAEQIKADILSGTLLEEEQVMSTNQYAAFYRINPATAARGFQELVDEGIIYKKRGIGMFVSAGAPAALKQERRRVFATERLEPLVKEARYLEISLSELLHQIEQVHATLEHTDMEESNHDKHD